MAHAEIAEATSIQSELWPLSKEKKKKAKTKTKQHRKKTKQTPNNNKVG